MAIIINNRTYALGMDEMKDSYKDLQHKVVKDLKKIKEFKKLKIEVSFFTFKDSDEGEFLAMDACDYYYGEHIATREIWYIINDYIARGKIKKWNVHEIDGTSSTRCITENHLNKTRTLDHQLIKTNSADLQVLQECLTKTTNSMLKQTLDFDQNYTLFIGLQMDIRTGQCYLTMNKPNSDGYREFIKCFNQQNFGYVIDEMTKIGQNDTNAMIPIKKINNNMLLANTKANRTKASSSVKSIDF